MHAQDKLLTHFLVARVVRLVLAPRLGRSSMLPNRDAQQIKDNAPSGTTATSTTTTSATAGCVTILTIVLVLVTVAVNSRWKTTRCPIHPLWSTGRTSIEELNKWNGTHLCARPRPLPRPRVLRTGATASLSWTSSLFWSLSLWIADGRRPVGLHNQDGQYYKAFDKNWNKRCSRFTTSRHSTTNTGGLGRRHGLEQKLEQSSKAFVSKKGGEQGERKLWWTG